MRKQVFFYNPAGLSVLISRVPFNRMQARDYVFHITQDSDGRLHKDQSTVVILAKDTVTVGGGATSIIRQGTKGIQNHVDNQLLYMQPVHGDVFYARVTNTARSLELRL